MPYNSFWLALAMQDLSDQLETVVYGFSDLFLWWKQALYKANHSAEKVTLE